MRHNLLTISYPDNAETMDLKTELFHIKEKYGNKLRLEKGKGKLMKSDKSNHKFVRTGDNNHIREWQCNLGG